MAASQSVAADQSVQSFVAEGLENAKLSPLHMRVIALITAGFFLDLVDVAVFGSLVPDMVRSNFATAPQLGAVISATLFGTVVGSFGQGEPTALAARRFISSIFCCSVLPPSPAPSRRTISGSPRCALSPASGWAPRRRCRSLMPRNIRRKAFAAG
jgi:MFS family permease